MQNVTQCKLCVCVSVLLGDPDRCDHKQLIWHRLRATRETERQAEVLNSTSGETLGDSCVQRCSPLHQLLVLAQWGWWDWEVSQCLHLCGPIHCPLCKVDWNGAELALFHVFPAAQNKSARLQTLFAVSIVFFLFLFLWILSS